tara:strand:- start:987 stop:1277 length:291 start_codon:yes stop_codon:yes gene_type:complete
MAKKYYIANRKQNNFITHQDKSNGLDIQGFPGDVYVVEDNSAGTTWATRVGATEKTKSECQTLVNSKMTEIQTTYDSMDSTYTDYPHERPSSITLP